MLVGKQQVPPCSDVEVLRIHVHMQSAASINLDITGVQHPADPLQLLQSVLSLQYGAYEFECVIPVQTAVRYQFPVRTEVMVVSFRGHLDSRFRQLAYEPLACAVIGFYLDTEFPSERIIKFGCGGGGGSPCGYDQPLVPHSLVDIPYKPTVSTGYKIGNFTVGESEQQKFSDFRGLCTVLG